MNNLTISAFAKICGVGVETIRFYQRQGILNIPTAEKEFNTTKVRHYGEQDIRRLHFILSAKQAGFTLKEIKELLEFDAKKQREQIRELAQKRIAKLDVKIAELTEARNSLYHLVQECVNEKSVYCPIIGTFEK